jgi:hypothetical protein
LTWTLHEPQPVPARVASQTALSVRQPPRSAPTMAPFETPLQLQIWASSGRSAAESGACDSPTGKSSDARESGSGVLRSNSCCSAGAALVSPSRMAPASLPSRTISL